MLSKIPSWAVAAVGASIVVIATAISSTLLYQIRDSVKEASTEIAETRRGVDRLWSNHLVAEQRSTTGDIFFAQAMLQDQNLEFLQERAAYLLWSGAFSMWVASGEPEPERTQEKLLAHKELLAQGETSAYSALKGEINRFRELSATYINEQTAKIRAAESSIESLQAYEYFLYMAYVFFNLLGLMVTMCKDLPVWKTERRRKPST